MHLHRPKQRLVFGKKIAMGNSHLQEFPSTSKRRMSYTKRTERRALAQRNWLSAQEKNAVETSLVTSCMGVFVLKQTTRSLLFKFLPRVLETERIEEALVLCYHNSKYKIKLSMDISKEVPSAKRINAFPAVQQQMPTTETCNL